MRSVLGASRARSHCGCVGGKASGVFWRQLEFGTSASAGVATARDCSARWRLLNGHEGREPEGMRRYDGGGGRHLWHVGGPSGWAALRFLVGRFSGEALRGQGWVRRRTVGWCVGSF